MDLVEILKSKEDPWDAFRDLLKEICDGFPARDASLDGIFVRVSCPWDQSNPATVSLHGFLLLEAAEGTMESSEQDLELVVVDHLEGRNLTAVGSRLARQNQGEKSCKARLVVRSKIFCWDEESASALSNVMQYSGAVDLRGSLLVDRNLRKEGWAALREALSWRVHDIPHLDTSYKSYMTSARREDVRAIWECITLSWKFSKDQVVFKKHRGEEGLAALEQFLDLTNGEWRSKKANIRLQDTSWVTLASHHDS